jgi:hypothetical protein
VRFGARRALQSIRFRCLAPAVTGRRHPLGVGCPFRVSPAEVAPVSVRRSRYAVGRFLGFAVFPRAGPEDTVKRPREPLFGFRSPPEYYPADPSRPAEAGRLLSWASTSLQHAQTRRSTYHGLASPATFRPQGLVTLSAAYSLRAPAGFLSHRRRSWDSPFGAFPSHKVSTRLREEGPTYRFSCRFYRCRSTEPARQAAVSGL